MNQLTCWLLGLPLQTSGNLPSVLGSWLLSGSLVQAHASGWLRCRAACMPGLYWARWCSLAFPRKMPTIWKVLSTFLAGWQAGLLLGKLRVCRLAGLGSWLLSGSLGRGAWVWLAGLACCLHAWALLGSFVVPGVPAQNADNPESAIYFSCWLAS